MLGFRLVARPAQSCKPGLEKQTYGQIISDLELHAYDRKFAQNELHLNI